MTSDCDFVRAKRQPFYELVEKLAFAVLRDPRQALPVGPASMDQQLNGKEFLAHQSLTGVLQMFERRRKMNVAERGDARCR